MECETIHYRSRHYFPEHLHPNLYTFSYIISGNARIRFRNKEVLLQPNDLVVIPPFMAHSTLVEDCFHYKVIRVPQPGVFTHTNTAWQLYILNNSEHLKHHYLNWFNSVRDRSRPFTDRCFIATVPAPFNRFIAVSGSGIEHQLPAFTNALEHLNTNFHHSILLDELSDIARMSNSHFQRIFKLKMGISPIRYLLNLRIEKSKQLFKSKLSCTDIAYETGFYDQSHFTKYFKSHVGMIPKQYASLVNND
jgi:AraC-like DNA-binding protein